MLARFVPAAVLASALFTGPARADEARGPKVLEAEEGQPTPPGYVYAEKRRTGAIVGGAVLFGTTYALSLFGAFVGAVSQSVTFDGPGHNKSYAPLLLPAVGPFLQIGQGASSAGTLVLVADGIAQSAGLGLLIYGLASKRSVFVRQDIAVVPSVGNGNTGAMLVGRF